MKYLLFILMFLLAGCGHIIFGKDRVVYKYEKLSCLGLRCCENYYPGSKIIVCNEGSSTGDGVFIRYYFQK